MTDQPGKSPEIDLFSKELAQQREKAINEMKFNVEARIDQSVRNASDAGKSVEMNINHKFREKAVEVSRIFETSRRKKVGELDSLKEAYLLDRHKEAMDAIGERMDLAMELAGGEDGIINTVAELQNFIQVQRKIISSINPAGIVKGVDSKGLMEASAENLEKGLPPDLHPILKKLSKGEKLDEANWTFIIGLVRESNTGPMRKKMEGALGIVIAQLSQAQRMEMVTRMMEDTNIHKFIKMLVISDYLKVIQGTALLEQKIKILQAAGRKGRAELAEVMRVYAEITDGSVDKVIAQRREVAVQGRKLIRRRSFGHKNYAKDLFSLKGIGSGLLFMNGVLTVAANTLVNINNPANIVGNPYLWFGAAMAGAALHLSEGFGGLALTPTEEFAKLTRDKDLERDERRDRNYEQLQEDLSTKPIQTEFYYRHAKAISELFTKRIAAGEKRDKITLTLEDIEVNYSGLGERYKRISKQSLEQTITDFARRIYRFAGETEATQKTFIEKTYEKYEVPQSHLK